MSYSVLLKASEAASRESSLLEQAIQRAEDRKAQEAATKEQSSKR